MIIDFNRYNGGGSGSGSTDLTNYWNSAVTEQHIESAASITYASAVSNTNAALSNYTPTSGFATVNGSAITEGGDLVIQGGGGGSTEDIELPIAASVNELKGNIEARLDQQYYKKAEVNDIAARKLEAGQVDAKIHNYVDPAIAEVNDTIADKELPVSAALNKLNDDIATIDEVIPAAIVDINDRMVSSSTVKTIWRGSQNEYDAITVKDAATLYIII